MTVKSVKTHIKYHKNRGNATYESALQQLFRLQKWMMSQKLLKSQIPGRFLPGGDDLDDFLLADQRNKDKVIGVRQFLSDVTGMIEIPSSADTIMRILSTSLDRKKISGW